MFIYLYSLSHFSQSHLKKSIDNGGSEGSTTVLRSGFSLKAVPSKSAWNVQQAKQHCNAGFIRKTPNTSIRDVSGLYSFPIPS